MDLPPKTTTASLNELRSIIFERRERILSPSAWPEIYDVIRGIMGYSRLDDCFSASIASLLASARRAHVSLRDVCRIVRGSRICILGGSASLEERIYSLNGCDRVIAVDGAAAFAVRTGIVPDIVVGDCDGPLEGYFRVGREGGMLVIHAHGDNISVIRYVLPLLDSYIVTVQCAPLPELTYIVPGFTDGERAVGLALMCGASEVKLYGMNFDEPTGWWSKPWLRASAQPWPEKRAKLAIARLVIGEFIRAARSKGVRVEFG